MDWFLLRIPPHLQPCRNKIPISRMGPLIDSIFDEPIPFFQCWDQNKADVMSALELISIASFAKTEGDQVDFELWNVVSVRIRNWKSFIESAAVLLLTTLSSRDVLDSREKFTQSISSIEVNNYFNSLDYIFKMIIL